MIKSDKMLEEEKTQLSAQIYVTDFKKTLDFYTNTLGFKVIREHPNGMFAVLSFYNSILMINSEPGRRLGNGSGIQLRFLISENEEYLKSYYENIKEKNVKIKQTITKRTYGFTTFIIEDPNGFELKFCIDTLQQP